MIKIQSKIAAIAVAPTPPPPPTTEDGYPEHASPCLHCGAKAVVVSEGCSVCLACHATRCG